MKIIRTKGVVEGHVEEVEVEAPEGKIFDVRRLISVRFEHVTVYPDVELERVVGKPLVSTIRCFTKFEAYWELT